MTAHANHTFKCKLVRHDVQVFWSCSEKLSQGSNFSFQFKGIDSVLVLVTCLFLCDILVSRFNCPTSCHLPSLTILQGEGIFFSFLHIKQESFQKPSKRPQTSTAFDQGKHHQAFNKKSQQRKSGDCDQNPEEAHKVDGSQRSMLVSSTGLFGKPSLLDRLNSVIFLVF